MIMEAIIGILENENTKLCEAISGLEDPSADDETDLHERMAAAAMKVYIKTVQLVNAVQ